MIVPGERVRHVSLILAAIWLAFAAMAAAQDGFSLGLQNLPLDEVAATSEGVALPTAGGLSLEATDDSRDTLVYRTAVTPSSPNEFRLALWASPMGRLHYGRAEAEAMLGREGLVHGGRMIGLGMGTATLGDQSSSSLGFLVRGGSWSELTLGEKFAAGAEASFLAAILYALAEYAD
jgi:hypothetical protein